MAESTAVEKHILLSRTSARRLHDLARTKAVSEDKIVEKALDVLFSLTESSGDLSERSDWVYLSEGSLKRVWDNDQDAIYDNWKEVYGIPAR